MENQKNAEYQKNEAYDKAIKLLVKGEDDSLISEITGLTPEVIEIIKQTVSILNQHCVDKIVEQEKKSIHSK